MITLPFPWLLFYVKQNHLPDWFLTFWRLLPGCYHLCLGRRRASHCQLRVTLHCTVGWFFYKFTQLPYLIPMMPDFIGVPASPPSPPSSLSPLESQSLGLLRSSDPYLVVAPSVPSAGGLTVFGDQTPSSSTESSPKLTATPPPVFLWDESPTPGDL